MGVRIDGKRASEFSNVQLIRMDSTKISPNGSVLSSGQKTEVAKVLALREAKEDK